MPVVRRGTREVEANAMRGGQMSAAATAASEGAGIQRAKMETAGAVADVGERVSRFGASMFARMQEQERDAADQTALLAADNQLADWKNKRLFDPKDGAFTLKGENALPLPEQLKGEFDKLSGEIEAGLSTDRQRAAYQRLKGQEWQGIDLQVRRHVFGEMQNYRASELEGLVGNSINAAVQSALDPKLVAVNLDKAVTAIKTTGPGLGLGPEAIAAKVQAVQSQTHVGVISTLLAKENDQAASAYFEATKGQIDGDKQDGIIKALDEGTLRGSSQREADKIIGEGGTLTEQRAKAKALTDPKLRDQVEQRLEHNDAVMDREQREATESAMRGGYDILDQTGDVTKIPPALWTSYSGGTRSAMMEYAIKRAKGTPVETDYPTFYSLMQHAGDHPETFASVNLLQYRNKLDDSEFKQLAGLQLSLKNQDKTAAEKVLAPFRTHSQILDDTLALHGIDPNAKPDTAEGKAIAQLRRMLDQRVDTIQAPGKTTDGKPIPARKATNQDIQASLDALLSQQVSVPGSWWNIFPGGKPFLDTQKRLLDLTASDISAADRLKIEAALKARRQPVSDATVLDLYLEWKSGAWGKK
jgi:hypothetical protein